MGKRVKGRRAVIMRRRRLDAEPLCRICLADGRVTAASVPDHIIPLAKGGEDEDSNIRCLCAQCHDRVTREVFGYRPAPQEIGIDGWPVQK